MIRTLVKLTIKDDDLTNNLFDYITGKKQTTVQRVVCVDWKYEWIVASDAESVLRAMSHISKNIFSILALSSVYEPVRTNIMTYLKNIKQTMMVGLWKHYCKCPPKDLDGYTEKHVLSKYDLITMSDLINQFNEKISRSDSCDTLLFGEMDL